MRRSAVLQSIEDRAEALRRLVLRDAHLREDPLLDRAVVDPHAATAQLASVDHEVVLLAPCLLGLGVEKLEIALAERRRERVVREGPPT